MRESRKQVLAANAAIDRLEIIGAAVVKISALSPDAGTVESSRATFQAVVTECNLAFPPAEKVLGKVYGAKRAGEWRAILARWIQVVEFALGKVS